MKHRGRVCSCALPVFFLPKISRRQCTRLLKKIAGEDIRSPDCPSSEVYDGRESEMPWGSFKKLQL